MTADVEACRSCWANLFKKTTQASVPGWNFHPSKMWWWSPIKQCSKPPLVDDYRGLYYIILTKSNQYMEDHRDLLGEPQARFQPEKKTLPTWSGRQHHDRKDEKVLWKEMWDHSQTWRYSTQDATICDIQVKKLCAYQHPQKHLQESWKYLWVQFCIYSIIQTWQLKSTMDSWFYS